MSIISDEFLSCNISIKRTYFEFSEMEKQSVWYFYPDQLYWKVNIKSAWLFLCEVPVVHSET